MKIERSRVFEITPEYAQVSDLDRARDFMMSNKLQMYTTRTYSGNEQNIMAKTWSEAINAGAYEERDICSIKKVPIAKGMRFTYEDAQKKRVSITDEEVAEARHSIEVAQSILDAIMVVKKLGGNLSPVPVPLIFEIGNTQEDNIKDAVAMAMDEMVDDEYIEAVAWAHENKIFDDDEAIDLLEKVEPNCDEIKKSFEDALGDDRPPSDDVTAWREAFNDYVDGLDGLCELRLQIMNNPY